MNCSNCSCWARYTGENCDIDILFEVPGTLTLLIIFQTLVFIGVLVQLAYIGIGIYSKIKNKSADYKSVSFIAIYMMLLSTILEGIINVDPWGIYLIYNGLYYWIGFWTSFILCINATTLVMVVWFDIVGSVKKMSTSDLKVPRIICIVMSILGIMAIFGIYIIGGLIDMTIVTFLLSIYTAPTGVALIVIMCIYIPKVGSVYKNAPASRLQRKLKRNTKYMIAAEVFIIICILSVIPLNINDALLTSNDPRYIPVDIGLHIIVRTCIRGMLLMDALLLFDWIPIVLRGKSQNQTNIGKLTKSKNLEPAPETDSSHY